MASSTLVRCNDEDMTQSHLFVGKAQLGPIARAVSARLTRVARTRLMAMALTGLALVSTSAGAMSLALFSDTETVDATFSTGSIDLDGAKVDALVLSLGSLMPGGSTTDDVVVENDGNSQLRYSMTTSSTNTDGKNLRTVLMLEVRRIDVTTPATPCNDFDGASVVSSTALFNGTTAAGFGSSAAGGQTGDRVLDAAASETLCFRVSLPIGTGNAFQAAATTTTFMFESEQTANNP